MSAETLRRAAALMRERAEAATPGPWHSLGQWLAHDVEGCTCYGGTLPEGHEGSCGVEQIGTLVAADAKHAASWHPAAALAVVPLLLALADRADEIADSIGSERVAASVIAGTLTGYTEAVEFARAYLGEA